MNNYFLHLLGTGIQYNHIKDLVSAVTMLQHALSALDDAELIKFTQNKGILGNLADFAKETGSDNIADRIYKLALEQSMKHIDMAEFVQFSDNLFPRVEEAAEVKIPGAQMLCRSLADIRHKYEEDQAKLLPLRRRVVRLAELNNKERSLYSLKLKITDKYVGTCSYLDEWQHFGRIELIGSRQNKKNEYESGSQVMLVRILPDPDKSVTTEQLEKCLHDAFTSVGCAHEYDCCGCVSQTVSKVWHMYDNVYFLKVSWYRNV